MPTSTPTFHRNVPLQFVTHLITPSDPRLPFHITANLFVFFPLLVNNLAMPDPPLLLTPSHLVLRSTSQPVFFHLYLFYQAADNHSKKPCNHIPPPLILLQANAFDYLCIYYPWRYLSRTKKKDFVREVRHRSPKKTPFVVKQYFIVASIQETIIKIIKVVFFFRGKKLHYILEL